MAVKRIRGAARALEVLEAIARHQPVGVGDLSRHLSEHKSTLQRVLMTLSDDGWIRAAPGSPTRWELTARVYTLASMGRGHSELRHRARATLDRLCSETGESVFLAIPDSGRLITIDVMESPKLVRTAPYAGMIIPVPRSAAGLAMLAAMAPHRQKELLGCTPDAPLLAAIDEVRQRGFSISDGAVVDGSINLGAALLTSDGQPLAVVVVSAPTERMPSSLQETTGAMLRETVAHLSRKMPAL